MAVINIRGYIVDNTTKRTLNHFEKDYGLIVPEATSPEDVKSIIDAAADSEPIDVMINSPGGYVDSGQEIFTALKKTKRCTVTVESQADSAASVIAMAGEKVIMSPVGEIMIHNVSTEGYIMGDFHVFEKEANALKRTNAALAEAYVMKTGMPLDKVLSLMDKETWLTANQCIELGFADEILEPSKAKYTNSAGGIQSIKDFLAKASEIEKQKNSEQRIHQLLDDLDSYRV